MYIVEMLRFGERERHSYVVGVFEEEKLAILCGEAHATWRGGKYEYCITEHSLNKIDPEILHYHVLGDEE